MAIVVSIAGIPGTGKTRSIGSMNPENIMIFKPNGKPFSFGNARYFKKWNGEKKEGCWAKTLNYEDIQSGMKAFVENYGKKVIIIEDSTHLIVDEFMKTALVKGFEKFSMMAQNYYNMIKSAEDLDDDVVVYLINHTDETKMGQVKIKTIGNMLDEKVDIPSLLTVALQSVKEKKKYQFKTQAGENDFFKSPEGMFEDEYIPNDLSIVDKAIREYYGMEPISYFEDIKEKL